MHKTVYTIINIRACCLEVIIDLDAVGIWHRKDPFLYPQIWKTELEFTFICFHTYNLLLCITSFHGNMKSHTFRIRVYNLETLHRTHREDFLIWSNNRYSKYIHISKWQESALNELSLTYKTNGFHLTMYKSICVWKVCIKIRFEISGFM